MTKFYTAHDLRQALKKAGLPYSHTSVWQMEKKGIISKPESMINFPNKEPVRIYTWDEIEEILRQVKKHKS